LLAAVAAWRVAQQVRVNSRIERRAQRLATLEARDREQVASLRAKLERLESVG